MIRHRNRLLGSGMEGKLAKCMEGKLANERQ